MIVSMNLTLIDTAINFKKCSCLRIGQRIDVVSANIDSCYGFLKAQTAGTLSIRYVQLQIRFKGGNIVNVRVIDLTKTFDKVNHNGLFIKLMKRYIPLDLLELLEN